jgi:cytochrome c oxidase subunit 2
MSAAELVLAASPPATLQPAGEQASRIAGLWWFYFLVLTGVFTLFIAALMTGLALRRSKARTEPAIAQPAPSQQRRLSTGVISAVIATVLILFMLLGTDFVSANAVFAPPPPDALPISITGHQWWWDVRYMDGQPGDWFSAGNEFHVPAGRAVKFELSSTDVIHSFWIPSLHGKKDLIPGHPTTTWFIPRQPGTYRGRCAEFCGPQHAHMELVVTVDPPEQYTAWVAAQKKTPPQPSTDRQKRGQELFLKTTCVMCHTIQGTSAGSKVGPELTHVASKEKIGTGTLPTSPENLAAWIRDPQKHKPGVLMPPHAYPQEDLDALVDYLVTLK